MKKIGYCFKLLLLFVIVISCISVAPNFCLASREEAALSEEYQVQTEKETLKDKFTWEAGFSFGLTLPGLGASRPPENPPQEFLDTLDMTDLRPGFSFPLGAIYSLGAKYLATPRLEIYGGIPFTFYIVTKDKKDGRNTRSTHKGKSIAGDAYGGISYAIVTESKYRPLIITTLDVNSALSTDISLGDGFWDVTPIVSLRKFVLGPLYIKGLTGYTHRLDRRGIDPGDIIRYGGGFGFLSGNKNIELNLERTHTAKTKIGDRTLIDPREDLIMNIAFTTMIGKQTSTIGVYLGGLDEGFNWNKNSAGIFANFTF